MTGSSDRNDHVARICAEVILRWHLEHGIERWPTGPYRPSESVYRQRLDHFRDADLADPAIRRALATEQRSGAFELHCAAPVPADLWISLAQEFAPDDPDISPPSNLYYAADWLLEIDHEPPKEPFSSRKPVYARSREELVDEAQRYYASVLAAGRGDVLGGVSALLSSSLERTAWTPAKGSTTLLSPELLGLELMQGQDASNDLRDLVRRGDVEISGVIGSSGEATPE